MAANEVEGEHRSILTLFFKQPVLIGFDQDFSVASFSTSFQNSGLFFSFFFP